VNDLIFKIVFFIFALTSFNAQGQGVEIQKIFLENLKKNDEQYLRRFIKSSSGDTLNSFLLEEDIQQLRRRTGIANAELVIDTLSPGKANLIFQIREQRTLLPQLGLGGIRGNLWWQVGIAEYNLFGKEQALIATYLHNDGQANFKLYFQNSRINASPWGFAADIYRNSSIEPLYFPESAVEYTYVNTGAGLLGLRNLGLNKSVSLGVNYFIEDYEKTNQVDLGNSDGPDMLQQKKLLLKVNFDHNRIGYDYFYRTGFQWNLLLQSVSTLSDGSQFFSLGFVGRKFWRPYTTGNIAVRLKAAIATNTPSPFAPFVLDSGVNIRGVGNRVDRGTAQIVLNAEWRQTLFHTDRWAGQALIFSDLGAWRSPGGELSDLVDENLIQHFVGGGVRFVNKKVFKSTLRLDFGFDLWNLERRGLVFGIGQYF